jgi:hypothetical protein
MLQAPEIEELICRVAVLDRPALTREFLDFRGTFPTDFTREFLDGLSVDRMRHIFVALCLRSQRVPEGLARAA